MSTNTALDQIKNRVEGHTEGPWEVASDTHEYRGGGFMQVDPKVGSRSICDVTDQHKPNAELIAAAPKLLAALEAVEGLHVPEAAGAVGAPEQLECSHCIDPHDSAWRVAWPCPTIKAIEEALR